MKQTLYFISLLVAIVANAYADAPVVNLIKGSNQTQQLVNAVPASANATAKVDILRRLNYQQQEIQDLRGQLEVQQHDLSQLQKQLSSFYQDLDRRLTILGAKPGKLVQSATHLDKKAARQSKSSSPTGMSLAIKKTSDQVATAVKPAQKVTLQENSAYQSAYQLIQSKHYSDAVASMQLFIQQYPQGRYVSNAHYWLGELYLVQGKPQQAIEQFNMVMQRFPKSSKAADASLKLGYIYYDRQNWSEAKKLFNEVVANYPNTTSARLASARLLKLERAGN